jgi:hypothetical protein
MSYRTPRPVKTPVLIHAIRFMKMHYPRWDELVKVLGREAV